MIQGKYLTVQEAAKRLKCSEATIQRYCQGVGMAVLRGVRVGRQWLIPASELDQFERPPRGNPEHRRKQ